jgi:hypothetical protein
MSVSVVIDNERFSVFDAQRTLLPQDLFLPPIQWITLMISSIVVEKIVAFSTIHRIA